jgi:hypothetical protein
VESLGGGRWGWGEAGSGGRSAAVAQEAAEQANYCFQDMFGTQEVEEVCMAHRQEHL